MSSGSRASLRYPTGLSIGIGSGTVVASTMLAAALPATESGWRFGVVAVTVGGFAALVPDRLAVAWTGALAWLLVNGFLVDRFGELVWHGRADVARAVLLVAAAAIGLAAGNIFRLWSAWSGRQRFDEEWRALARTTINSMNFNEEETRDA